VCGWEMKTQSFTKAHNKARSRINVTGARMGSTGRPHGGRAAAAMPFTFLS
jgi:hypothetical protein